MIRRTAPDLGDKAMAAFGDAGSNTLRSCAGSEKFHMDNMKDLGLFNIEGVDWCEGAKEPKGAYARMAEASQGKDTTTGHWEMAGIISKRSGMPTYPDGFPKEVMDEFEKQTGRGWLVNKPYSGTAVIKNTAMST